MNQPQQQQQQQQKDAAQSEAIEPAKPAVSGWAIHRRLYDWTLSFAHHRHSNSALFLIAFAESSFFPIPPDVLLGPLCLGRRNRAWWFALLTTLGSVLGAILGWLIGWGAWEALNQFMYDWVPGFTPEKFEVVERWYERWGVWVLFAAAFTPIPFKVFTIAGGVFAQPLGLFIVVATLGRAARFFLVAGLFWWVGPKAAPLIDRHFNTLCVVFGILLVGGFLVIKWIQ